MSLRLCAGRPIAADRYVYAKTIFYIEIVMKKRHKLDPDRLLGVIQLQFEWAVIPVGG